MEMDVVYNISGRNMVIFLRITESCSEILTPISHLDNLYLNSL